MKLIQVRFDATESPTEFTVALSLEELALLYRLSGHIAPSMITRLSGNAIWGEALFELADATGGILNRFFDAGPDDVIPNFSPFVPAAP